MSEYIILNKTEIENLLVDLGNELNRIINRGESQIQRGNIEVKMEEYKRILTKGIPLTPVLEEVFTASRQFDSLDGVVDIDMVACFHAKDLEPVHTNFEEYLTTLTLPI